MRLYNNFFNALRELNLLFIVLVFLGVTSCSKNQVYRETHQDFPLNRWLENDYQEFEVKIVNTTIAYNFIMNFGYVYGSQFHNIPVEATIEYPSGYRETLSFEVSLLNDDNEEAGDCLGDICDIRYTFKEKTLLKEQGVYTVIFKNRFNNDFLPNVLAVGLIIEKTE